MDIRFLEKRIIWEAKKRQEDYKEMERKSKAAASKGRGRIGR